METPIVSVLMTAYNREKYIAEAIESVLASTFTDFELIIVDDGSSDHTVEIAKSYLSDARVQVHLNEKNLGDYPNRNRAASLAKGQYIKYLDSDDAIYPHGLAIMVESMQRFPEAGLGINRPPSAQQMYPTEVHPAQTYQEHFLGDGLLIAGPSGCIIRKQVFDTLNGFTGMRFAGDTEMWLKIAARYSVVKLIQDLVWWRVHVGQEYLEGQRSLAYLDLNYKVNMEALHSSDCPLTKHDQQRAIKRVRYFQARAIWQVALQKRRLREASLLFRNSRLSPLELLQGLGRTGSRI